MFLNLIILKYETKPHYSSTMANGIGQAHKLGKQNRKRPCVTKNPSNLTSSPSHIHDNNNLNIDVRCKYSLFARKYSNTKYYLQDATDDIIQNQSVYIP